ncbi:MAG: hypothetical protein ACYS8W_03655 [Planctomycetota bacterium]|jgi:hypothetical protein
MEKLIPIIPIAGIIIVGLLIRYLAGHLDRDRIKDYVHHDGGKIINIEWRLIGPGWFGSQNQRIYEVIFIDRKGRRHQAYCRTSLFSGIYWTEDRIAG